MTGPIPVPQEPDLVWWLVTSPGTRVLVPAEADADAGVVIRMALGLMGHQPVLHAQAPDGSWFTPVGPIPGDANIRWDYLARYVDACTARHAVEGDPAIHFQTVDEVTR